MNSFSLTAENLSLHNLQLRKQAFEDSYVDAIKQGHKTFHMVPESDPESDAHSQYLAFVLIKSWTSRPILARAVESFQMIMEQEGRDGAQPLPIRERPWNDDKTGYKFDGLLFDCDTIDIAKKLEHVFDWFLDDVPGQQSVVVKRGRINCNFCVFVPVWFGQAFFDAHSEHQKYPAAKHGKPQGPKQEIDGETGNSVSESVEGRAGADSQRELDMIRRDFDVMHVGGFETIAL